jgi:O-antigen/teichoic acid export membrane protein
VALRKFATNMAVLTAARMFQALASFLAVPILARLLGPAEYGLVAMAGVFVVLTMVVSDAGLGQTLVRVNAREREIWSSAFWFIATVGLGMSLLLAAISAPVAWLMREPRLTLVLLALAPLPFILSTTATASADLQQREQFRHLASAELISSLAGIFAAIGLALAGAGVWALVSHQVAYWLVKSGILHASSKFRPDFTFRASVLGPHLRFGRDTAVLGIVGVLQRQIDPLVIGRLLGTAPVGMYSVALRIAALPSQFFTAPLTNALFTRMVMLRDDKAATRDLFLVAAWLIAALVFPGIAVAASASEAYFELFLTAKWTPTAPIFAAVAPALAFQSVMIVCGNLLLAIGATGRRLRLNVEFAIAWLCVLPFAALHSLQAVAISYTLTYALVSIRSYPMYLEPAGCGVGDLFRTLAAPIVVSLAAAAACLAVHLFTPASALVEVAVSVLILGGAYAALALVERKKIPARIRALRAVLSARSGFDEGAAL